jgi:hypothetical protein
MAKSKGGRPSNAELAARGITKTELEAGLRILRRIFGPSLTRMIELSVEAEDKMPLDKQFKMHQDLVNMYVQLLKADKSFKAIAAGGKAEETPEPTTGVVFQLAK